MIERKEIVHRRHPAWAKVKASLSVCSFFFITFKTVVAFKYLVDSLTLDHFILILHDKILEPHLFRYFLFSFLYISKVFGFLEENRILAYFYFCFDIYFFCIFCPIHPQNDVPYLFPHLSIFIAKIKSYQFLVSRNFRTTIS